MGLRPVFAIKADIADPDAETFAFEAAKTMYGGKAITVGDTAFVFASEAGGGRGLLARGVVTAAAAVPLIPGLARQTPRVSVGVDRAARSVRALGRAELKGFRDWADGQPQSELNFKLYRQATNKIVSLSDEAARFLHGHF